MTLTTFKNYIPSNYRYSDKYIYSKYKKCTYIGCINYPVYAYPGEYANHCAIHRLVVMIGTYRSICAHFKCTKQSGYGNPGGGGIYCTNHKLIGMVNLKCKQCLYTECNKPVAYGPLYKKRIHFADMFANKMLMTHAPRPKYKGFSGPAKTARVVVDGATVAVTGLADGRRKLAGYVRVWLSTVL